jgi:hypothetical protein
MLTGDLFADLFGPDALTALTMPAVNLNGGAHRLLSDIGHIQGITSSLPGACGVQFTLLCPLHKYFLDDQGCSPVESSPFP